MSPASCWALVPSLGRNGIAVQIESDARLFTAAIIGHNQVIPSAYLQLLGKACSHVDRLALIANQSQCRYAAIDINEPSATLVGRVQLAGDYEAVRLLGAIDPSGDGERLVDREGIKIWQLDCPRRVEIEGLPSQRRGLSQSDPLWYCDLRASVPCFNSKLVHHRDRQQLRGRLQR